MISLEFPSFSFFSGIFLQEKDKGTESIKRYSRFIIDGRKNSDISNCLRFNMNETAQGRKKERNFSFNSSQPISLSVERSLLDFKLCWNFLLNTESNFSSSKSRPICHYQNVSLSKTRLFSFFHVEFS